MVGQSVVLYIKLDSYSIFPSLKHFKPSLVNSQFSCSGTDIRKLIVITNNTNSYNKGFVVLTRKMLGYLETNSGRDVCGSTF